MKAHSFKIGFLQAAALFFYVFAVVFLIDKLPSLIKDGVPPIVAGTLFLLLFVISAMISGSFALGFPAFLFFEGKKKEAFAVLGWCLFFLIVFFALYGSSVYLAGRG